MLSVMHQYLQLLPFPSSLCPACQVNRAASRSTCLCNSCQSKAYAFIAERKRSEQTVMLGIGDSRRVSTYTMQLSLAGTGSNAPVRQHLMTLRAEVKTFCAAVETLLSPVLLSFPLNEEERGMISLYMENLREVVLSDACTTHPEKTA